MIRRCTESDFGTIYEIINDAAQIYHGVIPDDRWHDPYMSRDELAHEIQDGVLFWGYERDGQLSGVMGIQDKGDVTLIRHAYVRTKLRKRGIGTSLLRHIGNTTGKPLLIGTWADASWAISFYQNNGFKLVTEEEKNTLLEKYWSISKRQVETSVVLVNSKWKRMNVN
ncbi:MAG: GNAT family N-acetyltransferase [Deltaproteobacteria bacterium]|nr:GNAT family N-acetyltransferase [Deltaproteobacteria bacterium]MBW1737882.1 GNAT family N-acetyltransferase [Deltaproteobacteria bacterium]MBW1908024.1 GNAT family N-acetyltransferase [Deltaproteobacteria bacterium]MBW2033539.1 GNAT family N-acetyltransferase [Deltaproteobacteria bacterium]MBW2113968.1 GNAT family N-acetyltransferase [Deltaproteobacteria bacterium]